MAFDFGQIAIELKSAPGSTAEERTDAVLARRGWNRYIEAIPDEDCRNVIMDALRRVAVRNVSAKTAKEIEDDRRRKDLEKAVASGMYGDLFADQYVGLKPAELASRLPSEQYWIDSLDRAVPRDQLVSNLQAVAELRECTAAMVRRLEAELLPLKHELAIFDEILRQSAAAHGAASHDTSARYPQ